MLSGGSLRSGPLTISTCGMEFYIQPSKNLGSLRLWAKIHVGREREKEEEKEVGEGEAKKVSFSGAKC